MIFNTRLEVRASTIPNAGNGVFTLDDIKQGTPVCYYAGRDEPSGKNNTHPYALHHLFNDTIRIGFQVPYGTHGVGQIINDAECLDFSSLPLNQNGFFSFRAMKALEEKYSDEKMNVCYDIKGEPYVLYARRDIKAGDELFVSYGVDYWISQFVMSCEYPLIKLLVSMKIVKKILDTKSNIEASQFMRFIGISENSLIYQTLGVDPNMEDYFKLKYITEKVIRLAS